MADAGWRSLCSLGCSFDRTDDDAWQAVSCPHDATPRVALGAGDFQARWAARVVRGGSVHVWRLVCQRGCSLEVESSSPAGEGWWPWRCPYDGEALDVLRAPTQRAA